jgi:F-type H+-transporting ATPase subunit a
MGKSKKIRESDMLWLLADKDPMTEVLPQALFRLWPTHLYFTNHMLMALVAAILMLLIFPPLFRESRSDAPSGLRNFFESLLEFTRDQVFRPALGEHTDRFLPFLWTLTFFILFCNVMGQIPLDNAVTLIDHKEHHFNVTATGALQTTGALALCAFVVIHVGGLRQLARHLMHGTYGKHGGDHPPGEPVTSDSHFRHEHAGHGMSPAAAWALAAPLYLWNFAPHPFRPEPGQTKLLWVADIFMWSFLLVLELIGALIKPFALMIRLFANMIAGHIVLGALIFLIPLTSGLLIQLGLGIPITIMSLLIRFLELFVAFLQTYIFVFLTTMFLAMAVAPEH